MSSNEDLAKAPALTSVVSIITGDGTGKGPAQRKSPTVTSSANVGSVASARRLAIGNVLLIIYINTNIKDVLIWKNIF